MWLILMENIIKVIKNSFLFLGGSLIRTHSITVMSAFDAHVIKHDSSPEIDKEIIEKYELVNM